MTPAFADGQAEVLAEAIQEAVESYIPISPIRLVAVSSKQLFSSIELKIYALSTVLSASSSSSAASLSSFTNLVRMSSESSLVCGM